ncbi:lasso RiPP family leader peptide-containing protein [Rhodocaloribacter sp.]
METPTKKGYEAPALTVYGSVATITGNQNAAGCDHPCGASNIDNTFYSTGK